MWTRRYREFTNRCVGTSNQTRCFGLTHHGPVKWMCLDSSRCWRNILVHTANCSIFCCLTTCSLGDSHNPRISDGTNHCDAGWYLLWLYYIVFKHISGTILEYLDDFCCCILNHVILFMSFHILISMESFHIMSFGVALFYHLVTGKCPGLSGWLTIICSGFNWYFSC